MSTVSALRGGVISFISIRNDREGSMLGDSEVVFPSGRSRVCASAACTGVSASRPGARSETMTAYLQRFKNLERIGGSFDGVEKCYAVQAGRELRIIVNPKKISDEESYDLARRIARQIEDELQYPGQIRVTMVRENRFVEYAK